MVEDAKIHLSESQLDILNRPFINVEPEMRHGLWRYYPRRWSVENGLAVRAVKSTISSMEIHYNDRGQVEKTKLKDERTIGYSIECAQRMGNLALSVICLLHVYDVDSDTPMVRGYDASSRYHIEEESTAGNDNEDLIELLDSHTSNGGPLLVKRTEGYILPKFEVFEETSDGHKPKLDLDQVIEIFDTFKGEN